MEFNVTDPIAFTGNDESGCTCDGECKRGKVNTSDDPLDALTDGGETDAEDGEADSKGIPDAIDEETVDALLDEYGFDEDWMASLSDDIRTGAHAAGVDLLTVDDDERHAVIKAAIEKHVRSTVDHRKQSITAKEAGAEAALVWDEGGDPMSVVDDESEEAPRTDGGSGEGGDPTANAAGSYVTEFGVQAANAVAAARSAASTMRSKRRTASANYLGRGMPPRDDDDEGSSFIDTYNQSITGNLDRSKPSARDILRNEATEKAAEEKQANAASLAANAAEQAGLDDEWAPVIRLAANRYPRQNPYMALQKAVGEINRESRPKGWEEVLSGERQGAERGGVLSSYGVERSKKTALGGDLYGDSSDDGRTRR